MEEILEEEEFCRLCAEPTPNEAMVSAYSEKGTHADIATKMLWININVSTVNSLPHTICFSCFDQLERTWVFLNRVKTAQTKLNNIFCEKPVESSSSTCTKSVSSEAAVAGKPVNKDWEEFQDVKMEVKPESMGEEVIEQTYIKSERNSFDNRCESEVNSPDSDVPLLVIGNKKRKLKHNNICMEMDDAGQSNTLSWDDYTCHCASCDAHCENISSLRLHYQEIHSKCCSFKCIDCRKVINRFTSFVRHVRSHRTLLKYCCEYCNKRFMLISNLKKHRNTTHKNIDLIMCQKCGAMFESPEQLQDHIVIYRDPYRKCITKQEKLDDLKCEHCNKEFKSRSNLQTHKLVHTERNREFACHVCGKMFFTKGTLGTHMSTHEDKKPFKCEFCPMTFRARGNLKSHISLHSGAKPFVCEQCGNSFRVKRHLKSHSIVHTNLMPYECEYCKKRFRFKTRLNLHLRQHTGAKPYSCTYCQRDFTNGSNYKKHMRRRHNIDTSRKKYSNVVVETVDQKVDVMPSSRGRNKVM